MLEAVENENDLGITFDGNLQFTQHVVTCSVKAQQRIGLIRRNFKCINDQIFILLYKSLVRPLLEYANGPQPTKRIVIVWKGYREERPN